MRPNNQHQQPTVKSTGSQQPPTFLRHRYRAQTEIATQPKKEVHRNRVLGASTSLGVGASGTGTSGTGKMGTGTTQNHYVRRRISVTAARPLSPDPVPEHEDSPFVPSRSKLVLSVDSSQECSSRMRSVASSPGSLAALSPSGSSAPTQSPLTTSGLHELLQQDKKDGRKVLFPSPKKPQDTVVYNLPQQPQKPRPSSILGTSLSPTNVTQEFSVTPPITPPRATEEEHPFMTTRRQQIVGDPGTPSSHRHPVATISGTQYKKNSVSLYQILQGAGKGK